MDGLLYVQNLYIRMRMRWTNETELVSWGTRAAHTSIPGVPSTPSSGRGAVVGRGAHGGGSVPLAASRVAPAVPPLHGPDRQCAGMGPNVAAFFHASSRAGARPSQRTAGGKG